MIKYVIKAIEYLKFIKTIESHLHMNDGPKLF